MRRSFVTVGFAVLVGASIAQAQAQQQTPPAPPAQQQAAAAPAPVEDSLRFKTDTAAIFFSVNPEKTADFESGYGSVLSTLASSTKPGMKELGASMALHKLVLPPLPATPGAAPLPAQPVIYVMWIQNTNKELSYVYGKIIYYSGKEPGTAYDGIYEKQEDATAVFTKLRDSIAQINPFPLAKIGG